MRISTSPGRSNYLFRAPRTMFTLDQVVPWGRSFEEYRRMFALTDRDLAGRVLGCADGPASFNAEATTRGSRVVFSDSARRQSDDADSLHPVIALHRLRLLRHTRRLELHAATTSAPKLPIDDEVDGIRTEPRPERRPLVVRHRRDFHRRHPIGGQPCSRASIRRSGTSHISATNTKMASEIHWLTKATGIAAA
jgi:hypothetical protein